MEWRDTFGDQIFPTIVSKALTTVECRTPLLPIDPCVYGLVSKHCEGQQRTQIERKFDCKAGEPPCAKVSEPVGCETSELQIEIATPCAEEAQRDSLWHSRSQPGKKVAIQSYVLLTKTRYMCSDALPM